MLNRAVDGVFVSTAEGFEEPQARAIAVHGSTGRVYVTGASDGGPSGWDYATVAYDSSGNQLFVARYNGPANSSDFANAIAVDSLTGNAYVTGSSPGAGGFDYATVAYDSTGNQLWVARYNGPGNSFDIANGIVADGATRNVYVTGQSVGISGFSDYATVMYSQP